MLNPHRAALLAALGAAAILAAGCKTSTGTSPATPGASAGSTSAASSSGPAHSEDVAITSCAPDDAGFAAAKVTVTNHSSKTSNYAITVAMESPDGKTQIGTGLVAVENLASGQQSVQDTSSLVNATGPYTCKVVDITRYAS